MSEFQMYLKLGFQHISDIQAYDHMLFIITLCAVYQLKEWRNILVLVTAFTIGHSITLALSVLNVIQVPTALVETLIPITILVTSIHNIKVKGTHNAVFSRMLSINYLLALFFGFIHGMGFSNYFRALMFESESVVLPLFAFNLGIEIGQLLIVLSFFSVYFLLSKVFNIVHREWNLFISGAGAGVSIILIIEALIE